MLFSRAARAPFARGQKKGMAISAVPVLPSASTDTVMQAPALPVRGFQPPFFILFALLVSFYDTRFERFAFMRSL